LTQDAITVDQTVHNLTDHLTIGEADDQTVLGRLVLVLVLTDETLALTVVRLALAATTELDLVARIVRLVLLAFDKRLGKIEREVLSERDLQKFLRPDSTATYHRSSRARSSLSRDLFLRKSLPCRKSLMQR
jgi:hypothetical protein